MSDMVAKWGEAVAQRGFTQIPNYLLHVNSYVQADVQLSPAEMIVLLQLVGTWWRKDQKPFPSMSLLARRSDLSQRQVQRCIKALEAKGYLRKERGSASGVIASNNYDLKPLVERLNRIADHFRTEHPRKTSPTPAPGPAPANLKKSAKRPRIVRRRSA